MSVQYVHVCIYIYIYIYVDCVTAINYIIAFMLYSSKPLADILYNSYYIIHSQTISHDMIGISKFGRRTARLCRRREHMVGENMVVAEFIHFWGFYARTILTPTMFSRGRL